jgi:putative GTP pyrophosphokinase
MPPASDAKIRASDDLWQQNPGLIKRFLAIQPDSQQLFTEVEYILRKKISEQGIETSSVTSRAKTLNSFLEKLQRKHYGDPFAELTDLAGARVVCLYRSDTPKVAAIIRADFEVIEDVDKLGDLGVDQFGYGARHFVVRLGEGSSGARSSNGCVRFKLGR